MTFSEIPHHNLPSIEHNSRHAEHNTHYTTLTHNDLHHFFHLESFGVEQVAFHGGVP